MGRRSPSPQPALKEDSVGTGGTQRRSPPPGDGGFLEAPSFARRLAVGSFVFHSPGKAPEKWGETRAGGHRVWWQLVEKGSGVRYSCFRQLLLTPGARSVALLFSCGLFSCPGGEWFPGLLVDGCWPLLSERKIKVLCRPLHPNSLETQTT